MIEETISEREAQRFYDRHGQRLEFSDAFEGRAKALAWSWCALEPGHRVLELGVGEAWLERLFMGLWSRIHALAPAQVGGCRPLELSPFLAAAGFHVVRRQHVGQLGTPSEVLLAQLA